MYRKDFNHDFFEGKAKEKEFVNKMVEVYSSVKKAKDAEKIFYNNDDKYDISIPVIGHNVWFEVKDDSMANKTGNIAIEFECRGKPSGIVTTGAKWWVQVYDDLFHIIPVSLLRQKIEEKEYFRVIINGGDPGSNTHLYLFKQEVFDAWCRTL